VSSGSELGLIQRHLDELLDLLAASQGAADGSFSPPVDLEESDTHYVVRVDLPGVAASDLAITLRERELRLAGRKPPGRDQPGRGHCRHMERGFGPFEVEVLLPGPVNPDAARAALRAGVLEINLPRVRERRDSVYTVPVADEEP
jgi:HSP20 family protein